MKKRRLLIIHESGVFQSIIKRTLIAEVPDVDLHAVSSARHAVKRLEEETFDMVISANEMGEMNGADIYNMMKDSGRHKNTGFLLLTSKLDRRNRELFKSRGIDNVLTLPFQAGELAQAVENLSSPREWRQHRRFVIPDTRVLVRMVNRTVQWEVVNISMGGMLANLKVVEEVPQFSSFYQLNIVFPAQYDSLRVNAQGYTLRQAALQWLEPPHLEILQCAWRFLPLSERDAQVMLEMLNKVPLEQEA
jgi:CheY-like chemotaxis protein